ncbi:hypothetical protein L6164_013855 [Bauhinia variegata]|uniref:Uncharacterized protein n=1 Tax=Bauhinia variegata TaxID=167791 RepID=A0ACB9NFJ0_BAUVA|nr:hypothetical protein L6164_013855 [Bauhinia variegata]
MAAVRSLLLPLFFFFFFALSFSPTSLSIPENEALLKLKQSFTNTASLSSWVPNSSPCADKWAGVICSNNIITNLHFTSFGLSGKIDVEALMEIRGIRSLSFVNNNFSGPMPELNKLAGLKTLLLTANQFSGPIAADFFSTFNSLRKVWISSNKFSGNLPESLKNLESLIELHVENNEFSGRIPDLKQDLKSVDFSNNKFEGQIPESLAKYGNSFAGNEGLCGKPLEKPCTPPQPEKQESSNLVMKVFIVVIIFSVVVVILLLMRSSKRRDDDLGVTERQRGNNEVVQVHVPGSGSGSTHSRRSETSRKSGDSKRGSARMGDLLMVNDEKGVFGLPDLMKAAAEVLGNGGIGSAYKAAMTNGLSVVVKRMREMNAYSKDLFDAEIRKFGRIRHTNILTPLAYHYRREEKLLVSEYIPKGSLLYVLHGDRGNSHAELNWATRLKIVQGIARGLGFLHSQFDSYDLPHGNLKSCNILLGDNYEPLLNDYAFHPLMNPDSAVQSLFAYKTPDYTQYQQVSRKTDVYCLGIIILEIMTGKFPSQYHSNGKGGTDVVQWVFTEISERREAEVIDPEIATNAGSSLNQMLQLLQIGAACTESNPEQRIDLKEAIRRIEEVKV